MSMANEMSRIVAALSAARPAMNLESRAARQGCIIEIQAAMNRFEEPACQTAILLETIADLMIHAAHYVAPTIPTATPETLFAELVTIAKARM